MHWPFSGERRCLQHLIEDLSRRWRREIILTQVNAVCVGGKAEIHAIIDDQGGAVPGKAAKFAGAAQKSLQIGWLRLIAELDERRASRDQLFCKPSNRRDGIGNGRKKRKIDDR